MRAPASHLSLACLVPARRNWQLAVFCLGAANANDRRAANNKRPRQSWEQQGRSPELGLGVCAVFSRCSLLALSACCPSVLFVCFGFLFLFHI